MNKQKTKKKTRNINEGENVTINVNGRKRSAKRRVDWKERCVVLLVVVLGLIAGIGFLVRPLIQQVITFSRFPDRGLPRINIELNGVKLREIDGGYKKTKYPGNEMSVYDGSMKKNFKNVEIRGRGNWTWQQEKKPYRIEFEGKVDMFGLGKARKWCLLASASDGTNLRNELAFDIARMLGMKYTMDGRFVELYVDGDYRGLYYLTHNVEIGKSVVNLRNPLGILVELDNLYWQDEKIRVSNDGDYLTLKDAVSSESEDMMMDYFLDKYNSLEAAIGENDYANIEQTIDIDSFAQYYLLSEFSVNPDAYSSSFYLYMDGLDDKIHAGPVWDFDLAFGNRRWKSLLGEKFYSPTETMVRKEGFDMERNGSLVVTDDSVYSGSKMAVSRVIYDLMEMPEFNERVKEIFTTNLSGKKEILLGGISKKSEMIRSAANKNKEKWGEMNSEEMNEMMEWLEQRYDYFESIYTLRTEEE